ncbi:MAG: hypothetical protein JXB00_11945 [Bacteroidales bacterium]|nr:hypothetical protein [Bacteroidales bacterium]
MILFSADVIGQLVSVQAQLDSNTIVIGDQIGLKIEVKKNRGDIIKFPAFGDHLTEEIEIIDKTAIDSVWLKDEDKVLLKQQLLITVFDSGLYYIPPIEFILVSGNTADTIRSRSNYLEVLPFALDTTNTIRDIKAIEKAPVGFTEIYPYVLAALFAGILVWVLLYYLKKKKNNEPILGRLKIEEPAHIIAMRELEALKAGKLWQRKEVKRYYSILTEIIRRYIERRFKILAMEQTTDEILTELVGTGLVKPEDLKVLKETLEQADLVKFAKADPLPDENETHYENACKFVNNTKFREDFIQVKDLNEPVSNEVTI